MKKSKLIFILLSLIFFSTCKEENMCDCVKTTGSIVTETRAINSFDRIVTENNLNVFITQDSTFNVTIKAGENIIPLIKTEVKNGILYLKNKNRCNWVRSYDGPFEVYVTMPIIKYITSNGSGNITSQNTITTDELGVELQSSGNVELTINNSKIDSHVYDAGDLILHGTTSEHSCYIGGSSFAYCTDLQSNYTYIHTYSTGECYVKAKNSLTCIIEQKGNVYCTGNPTSIEKTINSSGQLYLQ